MNGWPTNPNFDSVAYAATQIKNALDATIELGGENYVFWGAREEDMPTLLNTDMKREKEHLATMHEGWPATMPVQGFHGHLLHRTKADGTDQASI